MSIRRSAYCRHLVQRLSRADLEAVVGLTAELGAAAPQGDRVDRWLLERVCDLVDGEYAGSSEYDLSGARVNHADYPAQPSVPDEAEWKLFRAQNPFTTYAVRTGTPFIPARRLSDIVDLRAFRRTELWELVRGDEMPHAIQMRFPGSRKSKWVLEAARAGRNFSPRDVLVFEMLRPSLVAYEAYRALAEEAAVLRAAPQDERLDVTLSRREDEILDLVAQGASNAQIADRLCLSPGTIKKHLDNIYLKLEVGSRTAALARTGRSSAVSAH